MVGSSSQAIPGPSGRAVVMSGLSRLMLRAIHCGPEPTGGAVTIGATPSSRLLMAAMSSRATPVPMVQGHQTVGTPTLSRPTPPAIRSGPEPMAGQRMMRAILSNRLLMAGTSSGAASIMFPLCRVSISSGPMHQATHSGPGPPFHGVTPPRACPSFKLPMGAMSLQATSGPARGTTATPCPSYARPTPRAMCSGLDRTVQRRRGTIYNRPRTEGTSFQAGPGPVFC